MTKDEFNVFYKKNKLAVVGVPVIILIILVNQFILKPSRMKKTPEAAAPAAGQAVPAPVGAPSAQAAPPEPVGDPISSIPKLDARIDSRLVASGTYPYSLSKNIFLRVEKEPESLEVVPEIKIDEPVKVIERPDISYHGFFLTGHDKVAILKLSDRLLLTRQGQRLLESPFMLHSIEPDKIVIVDTQSENMQFEVTLSEKTSMDVVGNPSGVDNLPAGGK